MRAEGATGPREGRLAVVLNSEAIRGSGPKAKNWQEPASPDRLAFLSLLGHAQSRSMNDISHTPNTDQVGELCPRLQRQGGKEEEDSGFAGREPLKTSLPRGNRSPPRLERTYK